MKFIGILAFGLLLPMACIPATAQTFANPSKFTFDLRGGYYQSDTHALTCSFNAVRGVIQFHKYGWHAVWKPGVIIKLESGSPQTGPIVGLRFRAKLRRPPFSVSLESALNKPKGPTIDFKDTVGADGEMSFLLRWNADGDITAIVNGEEHKLNLGERPQRIEIDGSSGAADVAYQFGHFPDQNGDRDCKPIV